MALNLLQKELEKLTKEQLMEVKEEVDYYIHLHEHAEKRVNEVEKDEASKKKLNDLNEKMVLKNKEINKIYKKLEKYFVGLFISFIPTMALIITLGALGLHSVCAIVCGVAFAGYAISSIPSIKGCKTLQKLYKENKECREEIAKLISTPCYSISPELAESAYNTSNKKSKPYFSKNENEALQDDSIDLRGIM